MFDTRSRSLLRSLLLGSFALFSSAHEAVANVRRRLSTNATTTAAVRENASDGEVVGQVGFDRQMQAARANRERKVIHATFGDDAVAAQTPQKKRLG